MQAYLITIVTFLLIDIGWIFLVARQLYIDTLPTLLATDTAWLPVIVFYLLYPAGLKYLAIDQAKTRKEASLRGAMLGLTAYGTYTLTAQALFSGWTWTLTLSDCAWGTALSAGVSCLVWMFQHRKK